MHRLHFKRYSRPPLNQHHEIQMTIHPLSRSHRVFIKQAHNKTLRQCYNQQDNCKICQMLMRHPLYYFSPFCQSVWVIQEVKQPSVSPKRHICCCRTVRRTKALWISSLLPHPTSQIRCNGSIKHEGRKQNKTNTLL